MLDLRIHGYIQGAIGLVEKMPRLIDGRAKQEQLVPSAGENLGVHAQRNSAVEGQLFHPMHEFAYNVIAQSA